jgi:hypothetical protein
MKVVEEGTGSQVLRVIEEDVADLRLKTMTENHIK